jgi:hypothetical protein
MSEKEVRLGILRQYLLDVDAHGATLLEAADAISYVRWNFQRAIELALAESDASRKVTRTQHSSSEVPDDQRVAIESPMEELRIGQMTHVIESSGRFALWFQQKIVSPIIAEEIRILPYSTTPAVWSIGSARGYVERSGATFRFKAWETVSFPGARNVPPRVEPSPDELVPPTKKLE